MEAIRQPWPTGVEFAESVRVPLANDELQRRAALRAAGRTASPTITCAGECIDCFNRRAGRELASNAPISSGVPRFNAVVIY